MKTTVLFVCVHNAGRSQMAAGYLQALAGDRVTVLSAGTEPKDEINPSAIAAMAEEGIDIANNAPKVYPEIVLPGFISGLMWATAQICWFSANAKLGFAVAFPLISIGPGLVGALWGVFAFGEIKGLRNFGLLAVAGSLTMGAAVCIALSN